MNVVPAGFGKSRKFRPSPFADRYRTSSARPTSSQRLQSLDYGAGQTEATVTLKPGDHSFNRSRRQGSDPASSRSRFVSSTPRPAVRQRMPGFISISACGTDPCFAEDDPLVFSQHGAAPAGHRKAQHRPPPSLDRRQVALRWRSRNRMTSLISTSERDSPKTVDLPPGKHTLQLLLGDANHIPHNPPEYPSRSSPQGFARTRRSKPQNQSPTP